MTFWIALAIQTTLLLLVIVSLMVRLRQVHRQHQLQHQQLSAQLEHTGKQAAELQLEVEELRGGIIGVGQRVLQLESALSQHSEALNGLSDKQQALELTDPESKIYSRAMKMVQLGADLEEIMRECELPRAEAELLLNLHQGKTR